MADDALEAMALADASVHMYTLQHVHARLVLNVKRLIHLKDKSMDQLYDPFGLDPDSTQKLVLTTAETFRLAQQLDLVHKGLDEALMSRNNAQSRRKRYDRMQHMKAHRSQEMQRRARAARYMSELEFQVDSLTTKVRVMEGMLKGQGNTGADAKSAFVENLERTMVELAPRYDVHEYSPAGYQVDQLIGSATLASKTSQSLRLSQARALEPSQSQLHATAQLPDAATLCSAPTRPRTHHQQSTIDQGPAQLPNASILPLESTFAHMSEDSPLHTPVSWHALEPASSVPRGTAPEVSERGHSGVAGLRGVETMASERSGPSAVPSVLPPATYPAHRCLHQLDHASDVAVGANSSKLGGASTLPTRESTAWQSLDMPAEALTALVSLTRAASLATPERPGTNNIEASSGGTDVPFGSGGEGPVVTSAPRGRTPSMEGTEGAISRRVAEGTAQAVWPSLPQEALSSCPSGGPSPRDAAAAIGAVSGRARGLGIRFGGDHVPPPHLSAASAGCVPHTHAIGTGDNELRKLPEYSAQATESDIAELEALVFQAEAVGRLTFGGEDAGQVDLGVAQGPPQDQTQMVRPHNQPWKREKREQACTGSVGRRVRRHMSQQLERIHPPDNVSNALNNARVNPSQSRSSVQEDGAGRGGEGGAAESTSSRHLDCVPTAAYERLGKAKASHYLDLIEAASVGSSLSEDSFGVPRDEEKAAVQDRCIMAKQVLQEAARALDLCSGQPVPEPSPPQEMVADEQLQSLGLTGFALASQNEGLHGPRMTEAEAEAILEEMHHSQIHKPKPVGGTDTLAFNISTLFS